MALVTITDEYEIETIAYLKKGVIDEPGNLNLSWLTVKKWLVVPQESAGHFDDALADSLSKAFAQIGCSSVFAITTEAKGEPICCAASTCKKELIEVSLELAPFNFVLMPANRSVAILRTVYDYALIAGPNEFVRNAVGEDNIRAAWDRFEKEALDPWWEGRLRKIAERYRSFSGTV